MTSLAWYYAKGEVYEWSFSDTPWASFAAADLHHIPLLVVLYFVYRLHRLYHSRFWQEDVQTTLYTNKDYSFAVLRVTFALACMTILAKILVLYYSNLYLNEDLRRFSKGLCYPPFYDIFLRDFGPYWFPWAIPHSTLLALLLHWCFLLTALLTAPKFKSLGRAMAYTIVLHVVLTGISYLSFYLGQIPLAILFIVFQYDPPGYCLKEISMGMMLYPIGIGTALIILYNRKKIPFFSR